MAALATMTMGELNGGQRHVYPLFQKGAKPQDTKPKKVDAPKPSAAVSKSDAAPQPGPEDVPKKAPGRPRKSKNATTTEPANKPLVSEGSEHGSAELLEVDPNNSRRKRRKTDSPVHEDSVEEVRGLEFPKNAKQDKASEQNGASPSSRKAARLNQSHLTLQNPGLYNGDFTREKPSRSAEATMPSENAKRESNISEANETGRISSAELLNGFQTDGDNASVVVGNAMPAVEPPATIIADSKPKKILRLNSKTGTIGSPPTKKALPLESTAKRPSRSRSPKSRIVTIRYGDDELLPIGIGQKIEQILNGTLRAPVPGKPIPEPPPKAAAKHVPTQPAKTPHPFFLGKAALKQSLNNADTPKNTTDPEVVDITKFEDPKRIQTRPSVKPYSPAKPKSTPFTGFGKSSMVLKFPGAVEPAWPWQGMIHIRGIDRGSSKNTSNGSETLEIRSHAKKSKYRAVQIPSSEEVIGTLAKELAIDNVVKDIRETNPDEFPPLPKCLRLPTKHYEGGSALQRRIRLQIRTKMPLPKTAQASSSDDDIRTNTPIRAPPHPALSRVYNMIPTTMSAFDRGQCETLSWTQKYSPKSSADVLQKGREALILKEWLQKLTVQSVDTGSNDKPPRRASSEVPVKRKRKSKKLDGFIISSDEEDNDMDEITDPEDSISLDDGSGLLKKTTIRVGDTAKESGRVTNAVVISGPHGSGKTAAVYAVAKELGFEVFEINSSSRRSGKDILEKVGDMTRNHQVQCSQGPVVVDEDEKRIDDALAHDLQSGRQGTMNSFFQPKGALKPKTKPSKPKSSKKEVKDKPVGKALLKQQKQSLILVEEADILFEEDKNFWSTIVELTIISKRPIIITCTNESVLQMDALILHAIIRFAPPPIDLAVDYMLLVAACEGHVLQRDAIKSLYECRSLDLRASLTDLNFWCQFAVGDVKSGLSWFYPRWSPGEDVDDHGETIRVVSENTYETGMGCLSQDVLKSEVDLLDIEEEVLHEACDGWQLDVGGWQENAGINSWANKAHTLGGKEHDTRALKRYENFSSSMSDADLISGSTFAPENQILIDVNMPALSSKVKEDYILAHRLIEASSVVDFITTSKDISLWMRSRNRKCLLDQRVPQPNRLIETDILALIKTQATIPDPSLSRLDFSLAFDPISAVEKCIQTTSTSLEASSFDRTFAIITLDLAPYVRSIVAYDARLQDERTRMSNLLSEGGRPGKRIRTTRAAMSALEGGARSTTRRDRYFDDKRLNSLHVKRTGGSGWMEEAVREERIEREALKLNAEREAEKRAAEEKVDDGT